MTRTEVYYAKVFARIQNRVIDFGFPEICPLF